MLAKIKRIIGAVSIVIAERSGWLAFVNEQIVYSYLRDMDRNEALSIGEMALRDNIRADVRSLLRQERHYLKKNRYKEVSTLKLAKEFKRCANKIENICRSGHLLDMRSATLSQHPILFLSMRRYRRLQDNSISVQTELAKRYSGVLVQTFRRAGKGEYNLIALLERTWFSLNQRMLTMDHHYQFSSTLWAAATSELGCDVLEIKPKFMLRQFVDEIPIENERKLLVRCLYEASEEEPAPSEEDILNLFPLACQHLHQVLARYKHDLLSLSDGVFQWDGSASYKQYQEWLFGFEASQGAREEITLSEGVDVRESVRKSIEAFLLERILLTPQTAFIPPY